MNEIKWINQQYFKKQKARKSFSNRNSIKQAKKVQHKKHRDYEVEDLCEDFPVGNEGVSLDIL